MDGTQIRMTHKQLRVKVRPQEQRERVQEVREK
jgi:hypothetical protein